MLQASPEVDFVYRTIAIGRCLVGVVFRSGAVFPLEERHTDDEDDGYTNIRSTLVSVWLTTCLQHMNTLVEVGKLMIRRFG